jgi:hypothetical protein
MRGVGGFFYMENNFLEYLLPSVHTILFLETFKIYFTNMKEFSSTADKTCADYHLNGILKREEENVKKKKGEKKESEEGKNKQKDIRLQMYTSQ